MLSKGISLFVFFCLSFDFYTFSKKISFSPFFLLKFRFLFVLKGNLHLCTFLLTFRFLYEFKGDFPFCKKKSPFRAFPFNLESRIINLNQVNQFCRVSSRGKIFKTFLIRWFLMHYLCNH